MKQKNLKIAAIGLMLFSIIIVLSINNINSKADKVVVYKYTKDETVLRTKASSSADVSLVIVKGTKLKYMSSVTKGDGTIYDKVEVVADNNYKKGHEGYVLRRQLSETKVESDKRLIYIKNKTKFVQEAMKILNTDTKYSMKSPYRVGGYYGIKQNGKYVYDCSAFVSTLMNRVYGLDMTTTDTDKVVLNDKEYKNVWSTYTYFKEVEKSDSMFEVVDRVTKPGEAIDKKKLQIGDFILGDASKKISISSPNIIVFFTLNFCLFCIIINHIQSVYSIHKS